jgi:hypothetical protein
MWLCVQSKRLDGNNENDACGGLHLQSIMFLTTPSLTRNSSRIFTHKRVGQELSHRPPPLARLLLQATLDEAPIPL